MKTIHSRHNGKFYYNILKNLLAEIGFSGINEFQKFNNLKIDGFFGLKSYNKLYSLLLNVEELNFNDYYNTRLHKKQIVWHHSAGWDDARGMYDYWKNEFRGKVATAIGIEDSGKIFRGFDESKFAHHLGIRKHVFKKYGISGRKSSNLKLNQISIGVEICNGGYLIEKQNKLETWFGKNLPKDKIINIEYKGYKHFEKYTVNEIESLKIWTLLNALRFRIPLNYNEKDFWEVSQPALNGVAGLYTHNSYRIDKTDVSPQPELIKMAKTLSWYQK